MSDDALLADALVHAGMWHASDTPDPELEPNSATSHVHIGFPEITDGIRDDQEPARDRASETADWPTR